MNTKIRNLYGFLSLLTTIAFASTLSAAQYNQEEYERLAKDAAQDGYVRVMVTVGNFSLADIASDLKAVSVATENLSQSVLGELGRNALLGGYSHNGIGQMAVNVNEIGLQILSNSPNVIAFARDETHGLRIKAASHDGSIEALKSQLNLANEAVVDIFLNIDAVDYYVYKDGTTEFYSRAGMSNQIDESLTEIMNQNYASGLVVLERDPERPVIRASVNRSAFYGLLENKNVRAIRSIGYRDTRLAQWPEGVLVTAAREGRDTVSIALRGGDYFSPKTGYMTDAAIENQTRANRRIFDEIFMEASIASVEPANQSEVSLGSFTVTLTEAELRRLYRNADERILSINFNFPVKAALSTSTVQMNMASAWSSGVRGAGQSIVVMDSGVRKSHTYFQSATSPFTKVLNEGCYGTDILYLGVNYTSPCPSKNFTGDSPVNEPGAGEPYGNATTCASLNWACAHGTHVAGIAAGRTLPPYALVQGVAPDSNLVSAYSGHSDHPFRFYSITGTD